MDRVEPDAERRLQRERREGEEDEAPPERLVEARDAVWLGRAPSVRRRPPVVRLVADGLYASAGSAARDTQERGRNARGSAERGLVRLAADGGIRVGNDGDEEV